MSFKVQIAFVTCLVLSAASSGAVWGWAYAWTDFSAQVKAANALKEDVKVPDFAWLEADTDPNNELVEIPDINDGTVCEITIADAMYRLGCLCDD